MENKILVIDNYDSFTYNLVHYLEDLGAQLEVFRNDQIDIDYIEKFKKILLSPGPGIPSESGLPVRKPIDVPSDHHLARRIVDRRHFVALCYRP